MGRLKQRRIGPRMKEVAGYVAGAPGCTKGAAAAWVAPNGSLFYGYKAVNRAIRAGLVKCEGDRRRYALWPVPKRTPEQIARLRELLGPDVAIDPDAVHAVDFAALRWEEYPCSYLIAAYVLVYGASMIRRWSGRSLTDAARVPHQPMLAAVWLRWRGAHGGLAGLRDIAIVEAGLACTGCGIVPTMATRHMFPLNLSRMDDRVQCWDCYPRD
jgi:hypothetical protein